jgi:hypothetical protein
LHYDLRLERNGVLASWAGTVDLWDRSTYELEHERPDGTLTVILHASRTEQPERSTKTSPETERSASAISEVVAMSR